MYKNYTVSIPNDKGIITIMKKGKASYVLYQYGRIYNPEKKYNVPQRSIIGKVVNDNPTHMYPNEKFFEFYPDFIEPEEQSDTSRSCCLKIGSYLIIDKIMEEYHICDMLKEQLKNHPGLCLDLISYMIISEENVGQHYPDFAFCHPLYSKQMQVYSDSTVSRQLSSISDDQIIGFLNQWNKKRDKEQRIYLSYDSTNKNCQAGDIDIVEFGKAKVNVGTPIFNVSLAFDSTNQIPLLYEEYPGSINDVSQLEFMVDKVKEYQYKNIGFILDRGYFSKENIQYIDKNQFEFIIMAKGCKTLVSSIIEKYKNTFETDRTCSIRAYKVYGTSCEAKLYENDTIKRYFHIYYNPSKQAAEREKLEQKLEKYKVFIDKNIGKNVQFGKIYHDYFNIYYDKNGNLLYASERNDVISKELNLCGYFCIITSEKMTAEAALIKYKGRDISEKLFQADKSFLVADCMRVQSSEAVSSKLFLEFIALIVRNRIYNLLKEEMLKNETKAHYFTVPAALRELEKIEMVRSNDGKYRLDHAITKTQKILLASFGISEDDVRKKAAKISKLLVDKKGLIDEQEEQDHGKKKNNQ